MNKAKFSILCLLIAAVFFGIVTYGHFLRGDLTMGLLSLAATVFNVTATVLNIVIYRTGKRK